MKLRGFTLLQLVLTVAVLGILGMSVVSITGTPQRVNLDAAAREVQSDIRYAQQNAMMTGTTSGVSFVSGGAYTVYQSTTATPLKSPLTKQDMVLTLSAKYPTVAISGSYVVQFNSFGAPTTGGGSSVTLTAGSYSKVIAVTANTGRVTIQ